LITGNEKFNYVLLCNKICGVAHYNMKMNVVISKSDAFKTWYKDQQWVFARPESAAPEAPAAPAADTSKMASADQGKTKIVASR